MAHSQKSNLLWFPLTCYMFSLNLTWVIILLNRYRFYMPPPCASVITNGMRSPAFTVRRGTRQGCPISPLLFALAMEPLAEAIRIDPLVTGIQVGSLQHKFSLYADDILLYLSNPEASIVRAVEIIRSFGQFSGYKVNYSKSEAMPMTPNVSLSSNCSAPFCWSPSGFVYLGIHVTPTLSGLYKANFVPLIRRIKGDLARWMVLPLSLLGRVNLFQINILPQLLYPFQMILVLLTRKSLSVWGPGGSGGRGQGWVRGKRSNKALCASPLYLVCWC